MFLSASLHASFMIAVVSENWKSQCVRLKVTVKSDSCGDSQDCSSKGVCYTNVSMVRISNLTDSEHLCLFTPLNSTCVTYAII